MQIKNIVSALLKKIVFYFKVKDLNFLFYGLLLVSLFLWFSVSLTRTYQKVVVFPNIKGRIILHDQIINHQTESPYRYRILYPYLTEFLLQENINVNLIDAKSIDPNFDVQSLDLRATKFIQIWYLLDLTFIILIFASVYLFFSHLRLNRGLRNWNFFGAIFATNNIS